MIDAKEMTFEEIAPLVWGGIPMKIVNGIRTVDYDWAIGTVVFNDYLQKHNITLIQNEPTK